MPEPPEPPSTITTELPQNSIQKLTMTSPITIDFIEALGLEEWLESEIDTGLWEGRWDGILAEALNQYLYGNAEEQKEYIFDRNGLTKNGRRIGGDDPFTALGDSKNWYLFNRVIDQIDTANNFIVPPSDWVKYAN